MGPHQVSDRAELVEQVRQMMRPRVKKLLNELHDFFQSRTNLVLLDRLIYRHIQAVYGSPQQLFAVSCYEKEAELWHNWQRAAHQLGYKVRNHLPVELDALRHDLYLLLVVDADRVSTELRKQIENNRVGFRIYVLTRADLQHPDRLLERLPFGNGLHRAGARSPEAWFQEGHFLRRLQETVEERAAAKLTPDFFANGAADVQGLLRLLGEPMTGGVEDALASD
ncbi:ABC-three component system middle component 1 [Tumebacillus flagellatus]|nr:ABC-three component system middle component 1 [Tumebacillus flagellatus]